MGRWIRFFHGKNANELGSELFKFVKFYSSYPLIPKLYNTLRSISKNLVLVETFERKYFIECPKWLLQRLFFDFHYLFDFCAKKENLQNYFEFHFLHNHGKPRILVSFTKFRPILGVYHSCHIGLTTDNYLNR